RTPRRCSEDGRAWPPTRPPAASRAASARVRRPPSPMSAVDGSGCGLKARHPSEAHMKYLHTMVRVTDIDASLKFYCDALGLEELSRKDYPAGRYTLVFLAAPGDESAQVELTHNWDPESYAGGRNFGHLAYAVQNIYATCQRLRDHGVTILRPPRDGHMAFVRSPDNISIELLQQGPPPAPAEPWKSMPNSGSW